MLDVKTGRIGPTLVASIKEHAEPRNIDMYRLEDGLFEAHLELDDYHNIYITLAPGDYLWLSNWSWFQHKDWSVDMIQSTTDADDGAWHGHVALDDGEAYWMDQNWGYKKEIAELFMYAAAQDSLDVQTLRFGRWDTDDSWDEWYPYRIKAYNDKGETSRVFHCATREILATELAKICNGRINGNFPTVWFEDRHLGAE